MDCGCGDDGGDVFGFGGGGDGSWLKLAVKKK